jgi:hypothetical protein
LRYGRFLIIAFVGNASSLFGGYGCGNSFGEVGFSHKPVIPLIPSENRVLNYEALDGKTPAEVAGVQVKGKDRWMALIQNAFQNR